MNYCMKYCVFSMIKFKLLINVLWSMSGWMDVNDDTLFNLIPWFQIEWPSYEINKVHLCGLFDQLGNDTFTKAFNYKPTISMILFNIDTIFVSFHVYKLTFYTNLGQSAGCLKPLHNNGCGLYSSHLHAQIQKKCYIGNLVGDHEAHLNIRNK